MAVNPASRDFAPWADPDAKPFIQIQKVSKAFGDFYAVDEVSLDIYQGEFFSLLGGSGCGKTTLLRMLAGFEDLTEGRILIDGADMAGVPPYRRPVNMMFQSYALFPHMSVERNIAFGLRQDGVARAEIDQRVGEALALVRMERFAKRRPHQLSGGQRQRVALARSLIKRPKVLLLDEPLAALDKKLREQTQFELVNIQESLGVTFIIVTHDQEEAMTMSSRIAVMEAGRIMQVGTPSEIYEFPSSRFVADFIGSVNLFEGLVVEDEADHALVDCADLDLRIFIDHGITGPGNTPVSVAIRPEKMRLSTERPASGQGPTGANQLEGVVEEIAYLGDTSIYLVRLDSGRTIRVTVPNLHRSTELPISWEDRVWVTWPAYAAVVLNQ